MSTKVEINGTYFKVSMDGAVEEVCFDNQNRDREIKTRSPDPFDGAREIVVFRASIVDGSVTQEVITTLPPYSFDVKKSIKNLRDMNDGKKIV